MEGLIRKSNGFLPINFSNPKEKTFNAEGIGCGGGERSKVAKRKIGERLFSRYYFELFQLI